MRHLAISLCVCALLAPLALYAKPTIYVKNDNDKLEPALIPVSSTVIPLPVYKVGFSLGTSKQNDRGSTKPEEPTKLITVHHKKKATSLSKEKPSDST